MFHVCSNIDRYDRMQVMTEIERQRMFALAGDAVLGAVPDAWAAYAYGSFARGDDWPGSDLDLAVLLPPGRRLANKLELVGDISRRVHREVDLVDLREAGIDLLTELWRDGRPLFIRRKSDTLAWEAEKMSDCADFNPRRTAIVDLYMKGSLRKPA